jgi:hypothetical protein
MGYGQSSPSTFVVNMFSKHGVYVVLKKSKMWRWGGILQYLHDVMYMSINHEETIDDFKERGRVVVRKSIHKHRLGDAWTNYFWIYYHQFGK